MTRTPDPVIRAEWIGDERNPIITIDNFVSDPEAIIAFAKSLDYAVLPNHYYPGIRAEPPEHRRDYADATVPLIVNALEEFFGCRKSAQVFRTLFSLATTPPSQLSDEQRLPHHDTVFENRFAAVHFLCGPEFGGTAFFRHRSTGYETITEDRFDLYQARLRQEVVEHGLGTPAFISGDTAIYDHIKTVDAAYNRAVVFRGHSLHSGAISNTQPLADKSGSGRLSVVSFMIAD